MPNWKVGSGFPKQILDPMSAVGHKRTSLRVRSMSALPPKADIRQSSDLITFKSSVVSLERAPWRYLPFRLRSCISSGRGDHMIGLDAKPSHPGL